MKLVRVNVDGLKRLRSASTYTNGKLIAFVGPNEAGKSTLLEALALFTHSEPVLPAKRSRAGMPVQDDHVIAKATFALDVDEQELLRGIGLTDVPAVMTVGRRAGSSGRVVDFIPTAVWCPTERSDAIGALRELTAALDLLETEESADEEVANSIAHSRSTIEGALTALQDGEAGTPSLAQALAVVIESAPASADVEAVRVPLERFEYESARPPAGQECYNRLKDRVPRFLFFDEAARDLRTEYDLTDPDLEHERPVALQGLLDLAGLDFGELVNHLGDKSRRESMLQCANDRLSDIFKQRWRQHDLTVRLNTTGSVLEVLISEHQSRAVSALDERSDGLRTFVALTAFVGPDAGMPPILLIDEAETHLHYNAQADLVNMLTSQEVVAQVLYTTHSPGCLPRDLGRDVRFIEPARDAETSCIRHDFWSYESSDLGGFSPLLFVMGAGAAAFSSLRHAVIGEGPTEMLLLPSIIRAATGAQELEYQVAPGISTLVHGGFPALGKIAARACYLVDGDGPGSRYRQQLRDEAVPESQIFALEDGWAIEDLLDPAQYLGALEELGGKRAKGVSVDREVLGSHPIKAGAARWFISSKIKMPGSVAVAEHLLGSQEPIKVNDDAKAFLRKLDGRLRKALGVDASAAVPQGRRTVRDA